MPCDKPFFQEWDAAECIHTCYTELRGAYSDPIAIVLHEVDGDIEEINNRVDACQKDNDADERACHDSFHFGVGQGGRIINWVALADTAWSFSPSNGSSNCGTCGWTVAANEGAAVDPNLYTINIAVSTGFISGSGEANKYSGDQYATLVSLVGWLASEYSISVDQTFIWRHCNELNDFPDACPTETDKSWADFLTDIQACIDQTDVVLPYFCDQLCDAPVTQGNPTYVLGANSDCTVCGRYQIDVVTGENLCDLILSTIPAATDDAVAGSTELLTRDCQSVFLPVADDLCTQVQALSPISPEALASLLVLGLDDQAACGYMSLDPACDPTETVNASVGFNSAGVLGVYPVKGRLDVSTAGNGDSLDPATDSVVEIDAGAGSIIYTLVSPAACDSNHYWIKRKDSDLVNTLTINGGADTIDGGATITLAAGEAAHVVWNGTEWSVLSLS